MNVAYSFLVVKNVFSIETKNGHGLFNIERDGDLWSNFYQMFEHENNSQFA